MCFLCWYLFITIRDLISLEVSKDANLAGDQIIMSPTVCLFKKDEITVKMTYNEVTCKFCTYWRLFKQSALKHNLKIIFFSLVTFNYKDSLNRFSVFHIIKQEMRVINYLHGSLLFWLWLSFWPKTMEKKEDCILGKKTVFLIKQCHSVACARNQNVWTLSKDSHHKSGSLGHTHKTQ